jgi:perosamine synthetase
MNIERIPVAGPWVTDLEVDYVATAAREDWYGKAGQSVALFEREFAAYLGLRHAAATPHCTSALHLAYLALGLGPGDEVIVPESTWVATVAPVMYVGATPVFADIEPDSWCIAAASIERAITPRTKAIVTVDLYGAVPDMDAVSAVASAHGIPIIEDAAQAIGSRWHGQLAGTFGDVSTFSFHGTKTVTTGEGGMILTDRDDLFEVISRQRDHGRKPTDHRYFVTDELGWKYRMGSLPAAFGRAQLARLDELLARKRQIFEWYEARLADVPTVRLNHRDPAVDNTFWMVTAVVDADLGLGSRELMARFDDEQIDTRPFFPPLSSLPALAAYATVAGTGERTPVAFDIGARAVNLPSSLLLTEEQVDRVCTTFRSIIRRAAA